MCAASADALNVERLEPFEQAVLVSILDRLDPLITEQKRDGTANLLTWADLYQPLTPVEQEFLDACRRLKAEALGSTSHYFGDTPPSNLVPVKPEHILKNGAITPLDPQHVPQPTFEAYQAMMAAMQRDLGARLLVESGYRSPAYQLYLFMFYTPTHEWSIRETNRHVALPGHSEHGNPNRQAIDFINEQGINGEEHPEEFEALPEYRWLMRHAQDFGFYLSYPRDNPHHTAFEPWHWHHEPRRHSIAR